MRCSLIIPARNAESTLGNCLGAALNQTLRRSDYEVLVVDDGSSDKTREIALSFPGVRLFEQEGQGPAMARNLGAGEARGEVLVFTDSDCEVEADFLEALILRIESGEAVGAQGCYKSRQPAFIAQFGQVEIETRYARMAREPFTDFIGTYAGAYRRDVFLKCGGFDTGFSMASAEDGEFSFGLHRKGYKMLFEPKAVVYHQHPASFWRYLTVKFYRGYWRIRLYRRYPDKIVSDSYTPQCLKLEVLLVLFAPMFGAAALVDRVFLVPTGLLLASFLPLSAPFVSRFIRKGQRKWFMIPGLLVCRASALLLGMAFGLLREFRLELADWWTPAS